MVTYLVSVGCTHRLNNLLRLGNWNAALLGNNIDEGGVDLARHVGCVAADIEKGPLLEQGVDFLRVLLELVLYVDLARPVAGEGGDEVEFVAEGLLTLLDIYVRGGEHRTK